MLNTRIKIGCHNFVVYVQFSHKEHKYGVSYIQVPGSDLFRKFDKTYTVTTCTIDVAESGLDSQMRAVGTSRQAEGDMPCRQIGNMQALKHALDVLAPYDANKPELCKAIIEEVGKKSTGTRLEPYFKATFFPLKPQ